VSDERKIDYIIIGQGLAGSVLALELLKRKKRVIVFDEPEKNRASAIAAGLFNPITGKMMTRTWKADELFAVLPIFYSEAEQVIKKRFFYSTPLYRPFISVEEQNEWMGKSAEPALQDYIGQVFSRAAFAQHIHDSFGGLLLKNCGYIDTRVFLSGVREVLMQSGSYRHEHFDELIMDLSGDAVSYKDIHAEKIVYANGLGALRSSYFNHLPLRPLKGETLSIKTPLPFDRIYNRGVYIVPAGEKGIYKAGATYATKDKTEAITTQGKVELEEKLNGLLNLPYEITGQDWGFRPTTSDRRPMLGAHPHHPNLVMFNGMGTKGVSLAPYFAIQLADWMEGKGKIEPAVALNRFY